VTDPLVCACGCGQQVDPNALDTLEEVIGYSKRRTQGGQNHVMFRRPTGRLLRGECATKLKYGGSSDQGSLL